MNENARVAVLTTTLSATPAPLDIESLIGPAPVRLRLRHPLPSLEVPYFLYRIFADGTIVPMHGHWRTCEHPARRRV
jgi:hypothetical protein